MTGDPTFDIHRPFLGRQALDAGFTRWELNSSRFRRLLRGVYVAAEIPDSVVVRGTAALMLAPPSAVLSHHTAAALWSGHRLPTSDIHVAVNGDIAFRADGIAHHRLRPPLDRSFRHGLPVTSPEQTICHLARWVDLVDLVTVGDRMVKRDVTTPAQLRSYASGWDGQCRAEAEEAAALVRERVDSAPETHLRVLMVLAGLPEPAVDIHIHDDEGAVRFRIDSGFEKATWMIDRSLGIEYDGRWHEAPEQRARDSARRAWLSDNLGWDFEIVTADDLYQQPGATLHRLWHSLEAHGIPVPHTLDDGWRRHFPGELASA